MILDFGPRKTPTTSPPSHPPSTQAHCCMCRCCYKSGNMEIGMTGTIFTGTFAGQFRGLANCHHTDWHIASGSFHTYRISSNFSPPPILPPPLIHAPPSRWSKKASPGVIFRGNTVIGFCPCWISWFPSPGFRVLKALFNSRRFPPFSLYLTRSTYTIHILCQFYFSE